MRLFLLMYAVASAGCATLTDIGCTFDLVARGCPATALEADDVPDTGLAFQLPSHWLLQRRTVTSEALVIEAAERSGFGFTGATLTMTFRREPFPIASAQAAALTRLAPSGAMLGSIDEGERLVSVRWVVRGAKGWRQGQVTIVASPARPDLVIVFFAEWPRNIDETGIMTDINEITRAVSRRGTPSP